jgi:hypothetical protein
MHCFHASIIHFLWSLYVIHTNYFPATIISLHSLLLFAVPSETMDRGFIVCFFKESLCFLSDLVFCNWPMDQPHLINKLSCSKNPEIQNVSTKPHHLTQSWASYIHLRSSQPAYLRWILILPLPSSSQSSKWSFSKTFPIKICHEVYVHRQNGRHSSCKLTRNGS